MVPLLKKRHGMRKQYFTNKIFIERIKCVKEYFRDMGFLPRLSSGDSIYQLTRCNIPKHLDS